MMTRMARAVATRALRLPRRRARRRWRSPRKVSERAAAEAASPRGLLSQGSPLPGEAAVLFLPDWRVSGQGLTREATRAAGRRRDTMRTTSAIILLGVDLHPTGRPSSRE